MTVNKRACAQNQHTANVRLAIVRQKYNPAGGAERFVSRALQALQAQNKVDVSLIARRWESLQDLRVFRINPFYWGNVWRDWGFAHAARRLWKREKFDLVQSHERIPGCDIYRAGDGVHRHWLTWRARTKPAWQRITLFLNPYHHYVKWAEKSMFQHPRLQGVICNSHMVKQEIIDYFNVPEQRITVIYNGVDTTVFHPDVKQQHRKKVRQALALPDEAPVLLYVGSGFERKGVARVLRALVRCPAVYLVVVGHDKKKAFYQKLARTLGVEARVRFVGAQHHVIPFYGMADAFILPTLYDPFPNVCVEALACGLPVFTSKQCGCAELLEDGRNGWVVEVLDEANWVRVIQEWAVASRNWPAWQQAARLTAEPLTLQAMAQKMMLYYQSFLRETIT